MPWKAFGERLERRWKLLEHVAPGKEPPAPVVGDLSDDLADVYRGALMNRLRREGKVDLVSASDDLAQIAYQITGSPSRIERSQAW